MENHMGPRGPSGLRAGGEGAKGWGPRAEGRVIVDNYMGPRGPRNYGKLYGAEGAKNYGQYYGAEAAEEL